VTGCLIVWFILSFGFGILLVDFFKHFQVGGYKPGFWLAQQGSIFTFPFPDQGHSLQPLDTL